MMMQYTNKDIIICGMPAQSMTLKQQIDRIDVTSAYDIEPQHLALGPSPTIATFEFRLFNNNIDGLVDLFPVGEGQVSTHHLGPSDVCAYCGSAWLPGTLLCPSCGAETDHFDKAIEYHADNTGVIVSKTFDMPLFSVARMTVEVQFSTFVYTDTPERMFARSLWRNAPAVWVCRFCGMVVLGHTSDCPGCGGKRYKVSELSTQKRVCVYCGRESYGNYACKTCNQRLLAKL